MGQLGILLIGFALIAAPTAPQERDLDAPPALTLKTVAVADGDSELRRLQKERYNSAVEELRDLYALYRGGKWSCQPSARPLKSSPAREATWPKTPLARVSELVQARDAAKVVERLIESKYRQRLISSER